MTTHKGPKMAGTDKVMSVINRIEEGITKAQPINTNLLAHWLMQQDPQFLAKTEDDGNIKLQFLRIQQWVSRLVYKNNYSNRGPTHVAKNAIIDVTVVENFVKCVQERCQHYKITPETVNLKKQTATEGGRCTAMLCVTADGKKLPAFVIFIGNKDINGPVKREVMAMEGYKPDVVVPALQKKGWADLPTLLEWIEKVWKPFAVSKPGWKLLMLDSFVAHLCAKVSASTSLPAGNGSTRMDASNAIAHVPPKNNKVIMDKQPAAPKKRSRPCKINNENNTTDHKAAPPIPKKRGRPLKVNNTTNTTVNQTTANKTNKTPADKSKKTKTINKRGRPPKTDNPAFDKDAVPVVTVPISVQLAEGTKRFDTAGNVKVGRREAYRFIAAAWSEITSTTIIKTFKKIGFDTVALDPEV
ncbi:hypothetical protein HDU76_008511 [Blyttiomyces sp. JEL0837]|nr:hypothetical protein HDU76_008511 [Blyttiomyces sp. JEL0837]